MGHIPEQMVELPDSISMIHPLLLVILLPLP
jgi:hypothetical protein